MLIKFGGIIPAAAELYLYVWQMEKYQKDIADQIDSMPIEQARVKIASGLFGGIGSLAHAFAAAENEALGVKLSCELILGKT